MADVRSLLRQERAARQQTGRSQKQSAAPAAAPTSKKRKAADERVEERKRTRTEEAEGVPVGFFDEDDVDSLPPSIPGAAQEHAVQTQSINAMEPSIPPTIAKPLQTQLDQAAEQDLDAFLQEMAEPPQTEHAVAALSSGAIIESAPMTAAEVAAQAREEQSAQRGRRDAEIEAEKEDAARQLEEEFEEMEGLEERVRKLREKREALRIAREQTKVEDVVLADPPPMSYHDEESESDDEDWDDWRFRPV
ncbi:hypothetical protein K469DRAFT_709445 [Zopfia rhizophila CBS 207.26]|uniref:Uncharacterized protein n=1 Tax=Zopfia rhizophila CBS 207.26 TaxID=1314779 RepID=A0A6A6EVQ6_9PEZI|nr:hypothetical protein K469DRAFT_709445 [Zopfia rhizophila CBS 207.26]